MEEYQTQSDEDFVIECGVESQYADLAIAVRRGLAITSSLPVKRIVASMTPMEYFKCGKFFWGNGWDVLNFAFNFEQYYLGNCRDYTGFLPFETADGIPPAMCEVRYPFSEKVMCKGSATLGDWVNRIVYECFLKLKEDDLQVSLKIVSAKHHSDPNPVFAPQHDDISWGCYLMLFASLLFIVILITLGK